MIYQPSLFAHISSRYHAFKEEVLKDNHCKTAQFWARYMFIIQMVLALIRATRKTTLNCMSALSVCLFPLHTITTNKLRSAVGNVSGYRCVSDCRSRGREFDPGPVPYFRGDWSWNNFYGHSAPFRWFIQEGLLSVTSESMCTNYWLTTCSSLPRKKCG